MSWIFNGRAYETVGNTNSDFMIKTKGKIKIQWGDKFIDLVKDGKINTDSDFLNIVKDPESIGKIDGIYYAKSDGSLWIVIGGNKINLKGDIGNVYVSYMAPQDTTLEQKKQAQYNIGLVYKTMADAQAAGITSGFVYIEELKKLLISDGSGDLTEYQVKLPNPITEQLVIAKNDSNNGAVVIIGRGQSNSLNFNNDAQIYYQDNSLIIDSPGSSILLNNAVNIKDDLVKFMSLVKFDKDVTGNMFQSDGATTDKGFRLFYKDEQSTLEVDNLIVRNGIELDEQLYPVKYYQEENVVDDFINENDDGATLESDFILKLDHDFQGEVNDYFCTFVTVNNTDIRGTAEINFKVKEFDPSNKHYIKINELNIITQDEKLKNYLTSTKTLPKLIKNKHIYYMAGSRPVTRIENHNIDMLNVKTIEEESDSKNVNSRLGSVKELEVDVKGKKITDYLTDEQKILGIYSDNALFEDPQIIQPEVYLSESPDIINDINKVNTKIGNINELTINVLGKPIPDLINKKYGIYSDNAVLEDPQIVQPELYVSENPDTINDSNKVNTKIGNINELTVDILGKQVSELTDKEQGVYSDNAVLLKSKIIQPEIFVSESNSISNTTSKIGNINELTVDVLGKSVSELTDKEYGIYSDNAILLKPKIVQPEIFVSESDSINNVTSKIGDISDVSMKNGNIGTYTTKNKGIYSDNAVLEESTFIKTKQYNTEFKNLDGTYPKYEEGWMIPEESDDQTIATTKWVQTHIVPMKEDIKKNRIDIDINANEIKSLWASLNALSDEVREIDIIVEGHSIDITELQNKIEELEDALAQFNPDGTFYSPVVLFSGVLQIIGGDPSKDSLWYASGSTHKKVSIGTISKEGDTDGALVMPLSSSEGTVVITSVMANQGWTTYMDDHFKEGEYQFRENEHGGHWFQTSWKNDTATIREFHQEDRNNCTWQTGNWTDRTANKWSVLIMGYISK